MQEPTNSILAGLRIVEMSAFIAAPLAGATLASFGADVIRIDPPGGGIDFHRWPLSDGRSLYWAGLNAGKRSVTIDVRTDAGRALATRLIASGGPDGGIFLTNLPVQTWNSYDELTKVRPDLIMLVITGDRSGRQAVDYTVNAAIGFPMITGPPDADGPVNHVLPAWDGMTAHLAVSAILAAERHRRLTGKGQLVELSLFDVAVATSAHLGLLAEAVNNAEPRGRYGNFVYGTFGRDFVTADGHHVMVLALTPRQWRSLVEATGLSRELADVEASAGADLTDEADRWRCRDEISELLGAWTGARTLAAVRSAFDDHHVLWGPYQTFKELVANDPRASDPPAGAVRFGAARPPGAMSAPSLGQHNEEVFGELERLQA